MALNIKDAEVDRLARQLAEITGESITESARKAFLERLQRVRSQAEAADILIDIQELIARARTRAIHDERTTEEILGYDEHGLPA